MESLPKRQQQVLQATVCHYVDTMEPVGSKTLVRRFALEASSSTVRSEMGALEQQGFLLQPHPSSGRIPSPLGYRHFVDCLMPPPGPSIEHLRRELTVMSFKWAALDDLLWQLARRLTDFTGLMSLITKPGSKQLMLKEVRLVQGGDRLLVMLVDSLNQASNLNLRLPLEVAQELGPIETWVSDQLAKSKNGDLDWSSLPSQLRLSGSVLREAIESHNKLRAKAEVGAVSHGMSRLLAQPEFSDSKRFQPLLELMDIKPEALVPNHESQFGIAWIGDEHPNRALVDCSVVQASYKTANDGIGQVALVGPMRMAYSTAMSAVTLVANHLDRILS